MRKNFFLTVVATAFSVIPLVTACADSKSMDSFNKTLGSLSKGTEDVQKILASDRPSDASAKTVKQPTSVAPPPSSTEIEDAPITIWVKKGYPWDNPLHSEF